MAKEKLLPQRGPNRLTIELREGASSGAVLDAVERHGDPLALQRDGRPIEAEVRIDHDQRTRALDDIARLDEVLEARWNT